jgi:hypothetical protein
MLHETVCVRLLAETVTVAGKGQGMTRLERFRIHKDALFRADPHSPLLPEQQTRLTGSRYVPENPALRFETTLGREGVNHLPVQLPTTTGERQTLVPASMLNLTIEGQAVRANPIPRNGKTGQDASNWRSSASPAFFHQWRPKTRMCP